jgi:copper chaperone NosL
VNTPNGIALGVLGSMAVLIVGACSPRVQAVVPLELTRQDTCAADGMILLDHAGPHAQIVWKDGQRTFYCEAREAYSIWTDPIERNRIAGFFVQDMGGLAWASHADHWIDAASALVVVDSAKFGSMGLSYVPFGRREDAEAFTVENGGELLTFGQISPEVVLHSEERRREAPGGPGLHAHAMKGMRAGE